MLQVDELKTASSWEELKTITIYACDEIIEEMDQHIASMLPGGEPTTYNPYLGISTSFYSLLRIVRESLNLECPFFVLMDDFDALDAEQQQLVFKCASERNHSLVCYKYGIMTFGRKTNLSGDSRTYRDGDDYDLIELIWLDKGLVGSRGEGNYKKTVMKMANKRIESSNWPSGVSFSTLFEDWKKGNEHRNTVKQEMRATYENTQQSKRPKTFQNYWDKQGTAQYFKYLRKKKIEPRYAGQNTIVDISSGIFRQFLEICSHIVSKAFDSGWSPESAKKIGVEIQNDAIKSYSNDMIKSIGETAGDTSSLSFNEHEVTGKHIVNLAESLSALFYERLHSEINDGEVIAIAIKGDIHENSFGKAVLDVAVRESILHRRKTDYPAKTVAQGKLPTYVLNRRLVPRKNLGVKLQGRHEVTIDEIELAARDQVLFRKSVIERMLPKATDDLNQSQLDLSPHE